MSDTREAIERAADWITEHMQPVADRRSGDSLATRILEASGLPTQLAEALKERDEAVRRERVTEGSFDSVKIACHNAERQRDELKARAEQGERRAGQWEASALAAQTDLAGSEQSLAVVRDAVLRLTRESGALATERDRLQEQVEQAREIMARAVGAWADVSGGEPDEAVETFDWTIYVMSRFLAETDPVAATSGSPDTETT